MIGCSKEIAMQPDHISDWSQGEGGGAEEDVWTNGGGRRRAGFQIFQPLVGQNVSNLQKNIDLCPEVATLSASHCAH